ncbi:YfcC family protein [Spiroplasma endosymbiont of Lasioglossum malachurum]|uniref:YfcC family protein n=1 Tax=Spiroplasma endosymbiont of Lasioglossum malachurum TaxID=3066319 RepID=UPI0030D60954
MGITKKKKFHLFPFKMPTAITVLFFIIALIIIISLIPGTTGKWLEDESKPVSTDNPWQEGGPLGIMDLFLAPIKGFIGSSDIIVFVLVIGGYIGIVMKSGALDAGIGHLVKRLNGKEIWIIPSIMTILSIGGTVEGMCEETIPYYLIIIPAMLSAGFDVVTAVLIILLGAGVGVMFSTLNPFAIATASQASGLNPGDGIIWRLICWFLATIGTIAFVMWYAIRVKRNPEKSVVFHLHSEHHEEFINKEEIPEFTKRRKIILALFGLTFLIMVLCIIPWGKITGTTIFDDFHNTLIKYFPYFTSQINAFGDWNIEMLAFLFFFVSIIIAAIDWKGEEQYVRNFISGSSELLGVALIIAVAGGIGWSLQHSGMQHVVVGQLQSIDKLQRFAIVIIGFFAFLLIAFVIPSTSGFAKAVFPIVSKIVIPLGLGSGMITTFVMASGWINLFAPSAGVMMAGLAIAKVPLTSFYRSIWPYTIGITVFALIMLSIGTLLPQSIF